MTTHNSDGRKYIDICNQQVQQAMSIALVFCYSKSLPVESLIRLIIARITLSKTGQISQGND